MSFTYRTVLVTESCLTVSDPLDCSLPDSSIHGILGARILEWFAIPSPGDLPDPGIEPRSLALQADSLLSEPQESSYRIGLVVMYSFSFYLSLLKDSFSGYRILFQQFLFSFRSWDILAHCQSSKSLMSNLLKVL